MPDKYMGPCIGPTGRSAGLSRGHNHRGYDFILTSISGWSRYRGCGLRVSEVPYMIRFIVTCLWFFFFVSVAIGQTTKNFSIDDVIDGFQKKKLFYYQLILENDKYSRTYNKCLNSKPADFNWMKTNCIKKTDLTNAFECWEGNFIHVLFVYESQQKCEEIRGLMKEKMDASKQ